MTSRVLCRRCPGRRGCLDRPDTSQLPTTQLGPTSPGLVGSRLGPHWKDLEDLIKVSHICSTCHHLFENVFFLRIQVQFCAEHNEANEVIPTFSADFDLSRKAVKYLDA